VFEKEIPPTTKGYKPTKEFGFYGKNLPENEGNPTVKSMDVVDDSTPVSEDTSEIDLEKEAEEIMSDDPLKDN
jgi:hypothetical protein